MSTIILGVGFPGGSVVKNLSVVQEMQIQSLDREEPLKQEVAVHSSILAWEMPWTEQRHGLQSMGSPRVEDDLAIKQQQQPYLPVLEAVSSHCLSFMLLFLLLSVIPFMPGLEELSQHDLRNTSSFTSKLSPPLFLIQVPFGVLSSGFSAHTQHLQSPATSEEATVRSPGASSGKDLCTSGKP